MARLIEEHTGMDGDISYRYIDEDWEEMACFMNDLRMYSSEEAARTAYINKNGLDPRTWLKTGVPSSPGPKSRKAYQHAWYVANKEKIRAKKRAWYVANKERIASQQKAYREANKEKIRAKRRAWYAAKKAQAEGGDPS